MLKLTIGTVIAVILFIFTAVFSNSLKIAKRRKLILWISSVFVICSCFSAVSYQTNVLDRLNKNIELLLFATNIDYFELDLLENPNENLCIHRKLKDDKFPSLNFQLGNRYYLAASYKEAIEKYQLAIKELEKLENSQKFIMWKVYCNLALAYKADGNLDKAKRAAKECLRINPNVDAAKKVLEIK